MNIVKNIIGKREGMSKISLNITKHLSNDNIINKEDYDMNRFKIRGKKNG